MREAQAQTWWDSMSTGTTMPDVEVIAELPPEQAFDQQSECLEAARIPGVTVGEHGQWRFEDGDPASPTFDAVELQWWVCAQQYPPQDEFDWMLSRSELEWLYDYYGRRYLPCLGGLGFEASGFPTRGDFLFTSEGYPAWLPFEQSVKPIPTTEQWEQVALRCPLPEMVHDYGLPGYTD